jgi:hypothetical protein
MRILEGVGTLLQLAGLVARLCKMVIFLSVFVTKTLTICSEFEAGAVHHIEHP